MDRNFLLYIIYTVNKQSWTHRDRLSGTAIIDKNRIRDISDDLVTSSLIYEDRFNCIQIMIIIKSTRDICIRRRTRIECSER